MGSIKDKVAIIGMGCVKFGELWDKSADDLIVEAAYEAYEDAGIDPKDIQAGYVGTMGSGWRGCTLSIPLKLEYIPISRLENACATGSDAFRNACYSVAAGVYDMVLVMGVEKLKDTGFAGLDTSRTTPVGTNVAPPCPPPVQFALAATRYFHQYGLTLQQGKETLAKIAVKNHYNGARSPKAHFQKEITLEQALKAPMVAYPLPVRLLRRQRWCGLRYYHTRRPGKKVPEGLCSGQRPGPHLRRQAGCASGRL